MSQEMEGRPPSLLEQALQVALEPLESEADLPPQERRLVEESRQFRRKLVELARGLLGSEYWELVSLVLIDGLESAKGALESEGTSDKGVRVNQGEAKAYRSAYNLIVTLSQDASEEKHE